MIKVTCEVPDYSKPVKASIRVHNDPFYRKLVEIEVDGERRTVSGMDLITAVENAMRSNS